MTSILHDPELRRAPGGKFRVVGVDIDNNKDWVEGDFDTQKEAIDHAKAKSIENNTHQMHVFNQVGDFIAQTGFVPKRIKDVQENN